MTDEPIGEFDLDVVRREGLLAVPGAEAQQHDGTGRVDLGFTVEDLGGAADAAQGPGAARA